MKDDPLDVNLDIKVNYYYLEWLTFMYVPVDNKIVIINNKDTTYPTSMSANEKRNPLQGFQSDTTYSNYILIIRA